MIQIRRGYTRIAILLFGIVIKIPNIFNERAFVYGMYANIHESEIWNMAKEHKNSKYLAKTYFRSAFGLVLVAKRYNVLNRDLTDEEKSQIPLTAFDPKRENYGILDNEQIVVLDYGHECWFTW